MRKSIRPVTLRRVIEVSSIVLSAGKIAPSSISAALNTTPRRAKEILSELQRMKVLSGFKDGSFGATRVAKEIVEAYNAEDWKRFHNIFLKNYDFYETFVRALSEDSVTKEEILSKLSGEENLNFNVTAMDMLCDWSERLGQVQRNLYTNKYYLLRKSPVSFADFLLGLEHCYKDLDITPRLGLRLVYTEIARLRESVCEKLKIERNLFDALLRNVVRKFIGKVELSGAPVTTLAKKSPSSLRMMEKGELHPILSPTFVSIREGKGLEVDGKLYQYIAFFEPLRRR